MELFYAAATHQDTERIFLLNRNLIDRYEDLQSIPYEEVLNWVRRKIENNIHSYTRIYADGIHVGFYRFVPKGDRMELDDLYIFPEYQGRGIGSRVIEKCCSETNLPVMLYVFVRNVGAWKLYQRLGFKIRETVHDSRYIMVREKL